MEDTEKETNGYYIEIPEERLQVKYEGEKKVYTYAIYDWELLKLPPVDQALTAQRASIYKELAEETIDVDVNWDSFSFTNDLQRSEALHFARSVWTKGVNQVMSKYSTPQQKEEKEV